MREEPITGLDFLFMFVVCLLVGVMLSLPVMVYKEYKIGVMNAETQREMVNKWDGKSSLNIMNMGGDMK